MLGENGRVLNDKGTQEVTFMTLWSTRVKFNKVIEEGRDSPSEIGKLNRLFDDFLEEQHRRKVRVISEINLAAPVE